MIDPLAMPVGADTSLVIKTMETISLLREEFGVNTTLGASNVSFGMPDRHAIGAAFLPMAITSGLTSAILDARAPQIVRAVQAADLLLDRDPWGASWIAAHRAHGISPEHPFCIIGERINPTGRKIFQDSCAAVTCPGSRSTWPSRWRAGPWSWT